VTPVDILVTHSASNEAGNKLAQAVLNSEGHAAAAAH
jgi:hypothetical protein